MKIVKLVSTGILFSALIFIGKSSYAQSCCTDKSDCCGSKSCCTSSNTAGGEAKDSIKKEESVKITISTESTADGLSSTMDPVTGLAVAEGSGVKFDYLGMTYAFENEASLAKFKAEPFDYVKDLECPVMGDAASKENGVMVEGTKYYLCCSSCEKAFKKNPEKFINKKKKEDPK
ncbi:hypothetical protein BH10BAC5_BH10BAC5_07270 [soil metagenome]